MIRKNTWILLGIAVVVLAAYLFYQESKFAQKIEPTPTSAAPTTYLFSVDASQINSLKVEKANGEVMLIARSDAGGWFIKEPPSPITDTTTAESVMSQIGYINSLAVITDAVDLELYGLATPAYTLTLSLISGERLVALVGKPTLTNSGYYVQLVGGEVQVVAKYGLDSILNAYQKALATPTPTATPLVSTTITAATPVSTSLPLTPTPGTPPASSSTPLPPSPTPLLSPQPTATKP